MNRTSRHPMRRILLSAAVLLALVGVFVVRLVDIQIVRAAELNEQAQDARSEPVTVYGARGDIVDTNGKVLADSVMRYDIALSPKQATKGDVVREVPDPDDPTKSKEVDVPLEQIAAELGAVVGLTGDQVQGIISAALADDPNSDFAYVAKLVDTETYEQVKALDIPWVEPYQHPSRRYPNGAVAGNLVGFIDPDGVPVAGLELSEDKCLASEDGKVSYLHSLQDWVRIPGTEIVHKQAHDGGTLKLTIDTDLQWAVQRIAEARVQETGAEWATVTVMEAKTGRLLAVADVPTVDPNNPSATDEDDRGSRSFTAPFEPGSTFKALTAASVINAGLADPFSKITAPYRIVFPNGANINDSSSHEDLRLTLTGVLIESSNTGMSQFGELMTDRARYDDMLKFGLGAETEVGFLAEEPGDLHGDPDEDWDNQTKYATMFGQGLTTTAVQIASVYQTIANDGVRMPVTLVDGCVSDDGTEETTPSKGERVISSEAARETSEMLERVYQEAWLSDEWNISGYRVAAKTGTAQFPDGEGGYRKEYLVSVSGFAPADDPQFVVSVSIMNPVKMNSSAASAPVFQEVMSQVLKKYRTVPSGAPAPELPATW
ncbi:peptidoglycan D,D-transpeptidase FtsI family protein [Agromyces cerinus]|uniref:Cell division protein FtsI (Penicillin-binding protein 3) n=1 Tax=Agromyces cerinus subsp. cerinus TaxID=232089 RepID=A0A1N6E683_9MICO|nr:penicillin-binding protein 2 [Agromyces cerinus]SIN78437.1 cell division protein FtsI (penicillin-binding protein 3) [Agromyces cerinus subsp. cerinus]